MIWYFLIQNTIDAISRKYQNISFFPLLLSVSDRFKPIVPFSVRVYPLKWHETEYFSVKPVKNQDYVLGKRYETEYFSVKPVENWDYVLGKQYETEYFLVKPVKNWDSIISELCLFVDMKQLQFKNLDLWMFSFKFS